MSLLGDLETIKYLSVIDLLKHEETYDKKRSTLTGEEVFNMCHERYKMMQKILLPLKEKLGRDVEITDIYFAQGMQDDSSIMVKYNNNGNQSYFVISNLGFNNIDISSSDNRLEKYSFVISNKKVILDIFNQVYNESLDSEFYINSTSKKFVIKDNCQSFVIKDINEKIFQIEGSHSIYSKYCLMYNKDSIASVYKKLKDLLLQEENVLNIYRHLRVYEEDFPKILIKKAN